MLLAPLLLVLFGGITTAQAGPASVLQATATSAPRHASFNGELASSEAVQTADWIADSRNNDGLPFIVIDKVQARVFVFDADGRLRGSSAALLGLARGDDSVPGIGERPLSTIRPEERTTPAGRFVVNMDRNIHGETMVWVDYDTAVSLHRVVPGTPKERRAQRLASPTPLDNRITFGCINVPAAFFDGVVAPALANTAAIVYVLPETRPARELFSSYQVN